MPKNTASLIANIGLSETFLIKLPEVLKTAQISRSAWLEGVKKGRFPAPVRLSARVVRWKKTDIEDFLRGL